MNKSTDTQAKLDTYYARGGIRNYRVTIERANGTSYVRDEMAESPMAAKRATLAAYREKYADESVDGFSHWIRRCVEIKREVAT